MEIKCLVCITTLTGRQTKFCSTKCKFAHINTKHQNYVAQQRRGYERKAKLVEMKGGCCETCGYSKNQAALCFHHVNPKIKSFPIDIRRCSNCSWDKLLTEADKCQLLCLNCHSELHNPNFSIQVSAT